MHVKVAYLINQYPKVSHSFIRREILALERKGVAIQRIAMRGWQDAFPDPQDREEMTKTRYVLKAGAAGLLGALLGCLFGSPLRFFKTFALATRMSRGSERPLVYHWIYFAEACVVARWVKAEGSRHLHAHFGTNAAEVAMLASLLSGLPFSFTVHGPEEFDRPDALGLPEKIRRAQYVVAISSFGRSQLYRWCEYRHWPKIRIVHCGIEIAQWLPTQPAQTQSRSLVCVGRLCEQKGQLLLLQALKQVIDDGVDCELVLAGDGEMRAAIEELATRLSIGKRLRITGWLSAADVRKEIVQARALVLPSFAEGLPVVLMEAMALGKPVISTYVAGIPELVDNQVGWLFPAGDVAATANAMKQALSVSAETIAAMGARAHERAAQRHDIDTEAAKLTELFAASAVSGQASANPAELSASQKALT